MVRGQRRRIALALALLTVSSLLKLVLPALTKISVDRVFTDRESPLPSWLPSDRVHLLVLLAIGGFAVSILGRAIRIAGQWCSETAGQRVVAVTRRQVFRHALRLPLIQDRIRRAAKDLASRLGGADWLDGAFSAGDLLMVSVLLRLRASALLDEFPSLSAYVARGEARPAYQRAFAAQLAVFTASSRTV